MRRWLILSVLLTLLLLAAVSGAVLSTRACPELPLAELLLAPADLPARWEGGASWKVSVPEYQTTPRHGLEPRANLRDCR